MKKFELTVLGSNAAMPQIDRHTSCQVLNFNENLYLIDCGDGTQLQLARFQIKRNRINHIFISHLHGDHCYGLPGLLASYNHFSRKNPLHLYGVVGIKSFIENIFELSRVHLSYELIIHELSHEENTILFDDQYMTIESFPLIHRIPCIGYKYVEKPYRNINSKAIKEYDLSIDEIQSVKRGESIFRNGNKVDVNDLLTKPNKCRGYAYMSDTAYNPKAAEHLQGITTLYHEATYLHDLQQLAEERGHSTAREAAEMAQLIGAKRLLMGHFSGRYDKRQVFREEAKAYFDNPIIVKDGLVYQV